MQLEPRSTASTATLNDDHHRASLWYGPSLSNLLVDGLCPFFRSKCFRQIKRPAAWGMRFTCWSNRSLRKGVADRLVVVLGIWWFESAPKPQDPPGSTRVSPCFFVGGFRVFRNRTIERTWFSPLLIFTSSGLTETGVHGSKGLVKQSTRLVRLVSKISSCSRWGIANCHVWLRYVEGMSHVKFRRVLPCGMPNPHGTLNELNELNLEIFASIMGFLWIFWWVNLSNSWHLLAKSRSGNPIAFLGKSSTSMAVPVFYVRPQRIVAQQSPSKKKRVLNWNGASTLPNSSQWSWLPSGNLT